MVKGVLWKIETVNDRHEKAEDNQLTLIDFNWIVVRNIRMPTIGILLNGRLIHTWNASKSQFKTRLIYPVKLDNYVHWFRIKPQVGLKYDHEITYEWKVRGNSLFSWDSSSSLPSLSLRLVSCCNFRFIRLLHPNAQHWVPFLPMICSTVAHSLKARVVPRLWRQSNYAGFSFVCREQWVTRSSLFWDQWRCLRCPFVTRSHVTLHSQWKAIFSTWLPT